MTYQSAAKLQQENERLQVELRELSSRYGFLEQSEARYRQIFENAPISLLCISTEGEAIEMNSAAEQFLGWTIADANEAGFNGFTDPTLVENGTISSFKKAMAGETVIEPPMSFEPSSTIGQGQWKWEQGHYYPIRDAAGQVQEIIEVALDLTAMYEVQQKLATERTSLLKVTAQVANLLLRTSDYTTVLPDVVRILGEAVESDRCAVMQDIGLHPTLNRPGIKTLIGWDRANVRPSDELTPPPDGVYLWDNVPESYETLAQGKVFNRLVADLQEPGRSLLQAQGNTSCLFVPILVNDRLWGLFAFDNCGELRLYDDAEIAILQVAAESIAAAIARQARDKELRESERRYRQLMDLAGEGIFRVEYEQPISVDLPVKEQAKQIYQQFRYAEHNLAFAQMYGYDQADALVGTYLAHVTDAPENTIQMEKFVQNGHRMRNQETVEIDRFGNKRYFLNNGFSIIQDGWATGGWGTQIDITELRETQQALLEAEQERAQQLESLNIELQQTLERLSESEKHYRTLFELSSEGIVRFGYHQPIPLSLSVDEQLELCYRSIYMAEGNEAFAKMYEYENAEDAIGLTLDDFHDRHSEVTLATMRAYVEDKHSARNTETVEFDRYGQKRYFLNSSVSTIENDCVVSTWVSQIDITELREAQQALLEAEQERAQKLKILNTELQQAVDSLEARDRILEATAKASNVLLTGEDLDEAVNKALKIIGESIDTDRIGIAKNWNNPSKPSIPHWRALYEWSSPQTIPQFSHPELTQGSYEGIEQWYELNRIGKTICRQLEEIPEPFRSVQAKLGVKTFYSVPIFIKDKWWGAIGFDDCREETHRSEAELSIVKTAAACIGSAIERDRTQKAILQAEQERVAELVKTNQALKNSLDRLADEPDLDAFLGHVLTEISQQLQIDLGYLLFYNSGDRTLDLQMQVTSAGTSLKHELEPNNPFRKTFSVEDLPIWDTLLETQKPFIIDRQNAAQYVFQGTLEWQTQPQEHQAGINILLTLGDEPIGLLALVSTKRSFSPQEIELAQALAQQATLAIQLTRLAEEAKQLAIFQERSYIASDVHDNLAQDFAGILMQMQAYEYVLPLNQQQALAHLKQAQNQATKGLIEARRSVWMLKQESDEYQELVPLVRQLVTRVSENLSITTEVEVLGTTYPIPPETGRHLLQIVQESIINALRHANARTLQVQLNYTPEQINIRIQDDGCGFDPETITAKGFGLGIMRQRSQLINARFSLQSELNSGTVINIVLRL